MDKNAKKHIYDFEVFRALVEIEIERIRRYRHSKNFSIAFLYAPNIAKKFSESNIIENEIAFLIREDIRSADVVSSVEEDFIFLFYPDTTKTGAEKSINRIKSNFDFKIIEGIASFPEDGIKAEDLYTKLAKGMNKKLIPVIDID